MMKKVLSVLLVLCLTVMLFPTAALASNSYKMRLSPDEADSGDGWSWDNETKALTLDGADIISEYGGIWFMCNEATIYLTPGSTNTICAGYDPIQIWDGITTSSNGSAAWGNLKITGEGTLAINYNATSKYAESSPRIYVGNLSIEGGNTTVNDWSLWINGLTVSNGSFTVNAAEETGIRAENDVSITGGSLTVDIKNEESTASDSISCDGYTQSGGSVTTYNLSAGNCTVTGGNLSLTGESAEFLDGSFCRSVLLKNCTVQINGRMQTGNIIIDTAKVTLGEKATLWTTDKNVDSFTPELITLKGVQGVNMSEFIVINDDTAGEHTHIEIIEGPKAITPSSGGDTPDTPDKPTVGGFNDVFEGDYYADAVQWAVAEEITSGTGNGKFSPSASCTREQIVTFLWRSAGKPEPTTTTNPFSDVKASDYFYEAVLWAVENNITTGMGANTFTPKRTCTRDQAVTFMWRAAGKPESSTTASFTDVKPGSFYEDAVSWAVEKSITTGSAPGKFNPSGTCTRGHIVTFLYRGNK